MIKNPIELTIKVLVHKDESLTTLLLDDRENEIGSFAMTYHYDFANRISSVLKKAIQEEKVDE